MASDFKIFLDPLSGAGDVEFRDGDIYADDGLLTAVIISLYTDRRARADDILPSTGKRGWWADKISNIDGDEIGSRLWLLERGKATTEDALRAREYAAEALQWMIDDGVAVKIETEAEKAVLAGQGTIIKLRVAIYRTDGGKEAMTFQDKWLVEYERSSITA